MTKWKKITPALVLLGFALVGCGYRSLTPTRVTPEELPREGAGVWAFQHPSIWHEWLIAYDLPGDDVELEIYHPYGIGRGVVPAAEVRKGWGFAGFSFTFAIRDSTGRLVGYMESPIGFFIFEGRSGDRTLISIVPLETRDLHGGDGMAGQ